MASMTYPGVYVRERESGVKTIAEVSTSIGAFVDSFARGLINEPIHIFGLSDFQREFGGIDARSPASYGIRQFFQNGGTEAWVVRVATHDEVDGHPGYATSAVVLPDARVGSPDVFRVFAGRRARGRSVENPGSWGDDLRVEVDFDTQQPDDTFNLTISEVREENGRRVVVATETFQNLTMDAGAPTYAPNVVNQRSQLVQLGPAGANLVNDPDARPAANGTMSDELAGPFGGNVALTVHSAGKAARNVPVAIPAGSSLGRVPGLLQAAIHQAAAGIDDDGDERAVFAGATVRVVGGNRLLVLAGRDGPNFDPTVALEIDGGLGFPGTAGSQWYELAGGEDGLRPVDGTTLIGSAEVDAETGLYALQHADQFNILCIPRAADLPDEDMRSVYSAAETYCEGQRAFLLIDIPESRTTLDDATAWMAENASLRHRNAAVYFPRTYVPDPRADNRLRAIGASGTIAGLFARSDATRGVWKAPAGTEARLQNVQELAAVLTDQQNGALNPIAMNCLRTFPVYGSVCWGARTLDGADVIGSEWKYLPIRRLALMIEESLYRGTKWVVFEPNDEPLWARVRLNVGAFMNGLYRQGAFQGTADKAYYVKCDGETTTQADRNLGIVNIEVGFAPLKPAEFVVITISQIAGDLK